MLPLLCVQCIREHTSPLEVRLLIVGFKWNSKRLRLPTATHLLPALPYQCTAAPRIVSARSSISPACVRATSHAQPRAHTNYVCQYV